MRPTLWLTLIACCFCVFLVRISTTAASSRPVVAGAVVPAEKQTNSAGTSTVFKREVDGFGETEDDARTRALENARDAVADYLKETHNETDYKPKVDFLQALKVIPATSDISVMNPSLKDLPDMKKATLQIQVSPDSVTKMCKQAREQRAAQRQHWMGLGLAGLVALLLVSAGYLRLEEATKGYYTGLLRFSALSLLGMAGGLIYYVS